MQTTAMRMFGHVQSEAATEAAGTTGTLETPDVEVIGAQVVSNMVQTAGAGAGVSILARIIWRNLKHLQDFYRNVEKLRNDVEDLNQKYEAGKITQEAYELGVDETVRKLEELCPKHVSKPLDTIYPNWESKVLGIKEENRPGEDNVLSANSEPSGEELAQAFTTHIADGDLYFAAAVDHIAASMTEPQLDRFLEAYEQSSAARGTANVETSGNSPEVGGITTVLANSQQVDEETMEQFNGVPSQEGETGLDETETADRPTPANTRNNTDSQDIPSYRKNYDEDNRTENNVQETSLTTFEDIPTGKDYDEDNRTENNVQETSSTTFEDLFPGGREHDPTNNLETVFGEIPVSLNEEVKIEDVGSS
jgi:hypothetical protein